MSIPDDYSGYNIFSIEDDRPWFRGYEFDKFKRLSTYRGEEVGEGGEVYAEPGMYFYVALLDIASMHQLVLKTSSYLVNILKTSQ